MWRLDLDYSKQATITNLNCRPQHFAQVKNYLEQDFAKDVITHKNEGEHIYDQPYAVRSLVGVLGYINDFTERPIETTHMSVNKEKKNFNMHFNCKKDSILEVVNAPIPSNKAEVSFA